MNKVIIKLPLARTVGDYFEWEFWLNCNNCDWKWARASYVINGDGQLNYLDGIEMEETDALMFKLVFGL